MSLNPVPSSLKSSVGSKSTNAHIGGRDGGGGGGEGEGGFFYHHGERSRGLCSSWISRLHMRLLSLPPTAAPPPPTPPARRKLPADAGEGGVVLSRRNDDNYPHTISTDESRTRTSISNLNSPFVDRRYLNLFERRPIAGVPRLRSPLPPPRIVYGDEGERSVSGFGPFQLRSRNAALRRGAQESLGRDSSGGERVLGSGKYHHRGYFPLFRRMAHLGEASNGEKGMLGSRLGSRIESVHGEEQLDQVNVCFPPRRAPDVHDQVKLSPFFQFRPSLNSDYTIARNKAIVGHPTDDGNSKILEHRSQLRSSLPMSYFPPQQVADDLPSWRPYEKRHFSTDQWSASCTSVQHAARSRGAAYNDGADGAGPIRTFCDPHILPQNATVNHLERTSVCLSEPEEPFSFWNMGRFKRRNTVSSTIGLTRNLSIKRNANLDDSLPPKFRKLGHED
ncbi:unnamed protein product [Musa acuminata subsp. malaccensis]|uniref:(wild Malaysian banana) hypothetical protein n=1 Tax=Musa acuminata subsp. malaccensis TaxID=214687 RepID=A0A804JMH8_MUSAM|nr:PREDICTED: uncharacterized protein LOC103989428 isoform X1 [Musa acuminata subsp. malaccensis]CAG1847968.1 unnamed protein product [Musa acuminata subsp. malaccensis]